MYVGVIPSLPGSCGSGAGIPHVCGGDPHTAELHSRFVMYSPCMWG